MLMLKTETMNDTGMHCESRPPLIGNDRNDLAILFVEKNQPAFRVEQVYNWLYAKGVRDPLEFTDMPKSFRQWLSHNFSSNALEVSFKTESKISKVVKHLFELSDGKQIEGVYIPEKERATLCVSSQVGCALGCTFCATGTMGLIRHLSAGEILDQLLTVRYREEHFVSHIVFMGMGEPLHNYEAVSKAVRILNDPAGCAIARRHLTVSTAGWVPGIHKMIEERLPCRLAISMGSPETEKRRELMPVTKKFPLEDLFAAAAEWAQAMNDQVTIEYTLLEGVNDSIQDVKLLVKLLQGIHAKVNVLTYNPGPDTPFQRPSLDKIERFTSELERKFTGPVTRRLSRGDEIGAACGQLVLQTSRGNRQKKVSVL